MTKIEYYEYNLCLWKDNMANPVKIDLVLQLPDYEPPLRKLGESNKDFDKRNDEQWEKYRLNCVKILGIEQKKLADQQREKSMSAPRSTKNKTHFQIPTIVITTVNDTPREQSSSEKLEQPNTFLRCPPAGTKKSQPVQVPAPSQVTEFAFNNAKMNSAVINNKNKKPRAIMY